MLGGLLYLNPLNALLVHNAQEKRRRGLQQQCNDINDDGDDGDDDIPNLFTFTYSGTVDADAITATVLINFISLFLKLNDKQFM